MVRGWLFITVAAVLLCTAPLHAQFITNGALNADASGWTLGGGCGSEAWDGSIGNPPGSILLNACGESTSDAAASQTISGLVVGTVYTVSVDVRLHVNYSGGGTGKSFGIFLNSEPGNPLLLTEFLDTNWHTVTTTFTATSSSATIILAGELDARTPGGPGSTTDVSYYIDNVSVTSSSPVPAVPAPSTALLVITGLLAVFGWTGLKRLRASRQSEFRS